MKYSVAQVLAALRGRAPQGARGLKYHSAHAVSYPAGRAPQGARGLKCSGRRTGVERLEVAPRKGRVG